MNFYIVDDDKVIVNLLKKIILQNNLGDVIGMSFSGQEALKEIPRLKPDIVLIDLLLPEIDGINIVSRIKSEELNINPYFIMISQVTAKNMISKSYEKGIEFFIHKPINAIEVISVINKVKEIIFMSKIIKSFDSAFKMMNEYQNIIGRSEIVLKKDLFKTRINNLFAKLGILGEAGTKDILEMLLIIDELQNDNERFNKKYKLSQIYSRLNNRYINEYKIDSNIWAIEQRVRRAINKALNNIASLGIEDYGNEIYTMFCSTLFDFQEVRKQMDYIRKKSKTSGKISVKKFLEGILVFIRTEF
ncbi:MAG: two-component system, response regulator GlnL [Candidatus Petromonas sp.]|nr:two-component system, response regulator GlnL [Candidatus Petromonas sp.]